MSFDEDHYAAQIGQKMWQIAKRRAREARLSGLVTARNDPTARIATPENKAASLALRRGPGRPEAARPNTLAEFLRALAAELGRDDPDRDES